MCRDSVPVPFWVVWMFQSQQIQQQQQTMMTDMITSRPNIPILRPSVRRNLVHGEGNNDGWIYSNLSYWNIMFALYTLLSSGPSSNSLSLPPSLPSP